MIYSTKSGDMFDSIAKDMLGDEKYKNILMRANPQYLNYYVFPTGISLEIPDITTIEDEGNIPPWRQTEG